MGALERWTALNGQLPSGMPTCTHLSRQIMLPSWAGQELAEGAVCQSNVFVYI